MFPAVLTLIDISSDGAAYIRENVGGEYKSRSSETETKPDEESRFRSGGVLE